MSICRQSNLTGEVLFVRYSSGMNTARKFLLAAILFFLFRAATYPAPFPGDPAGSDPKLLTISNVVSNSSSSTIVAKWVTSDKASSFLACGTKTGPYIHAVDRYNVSAMTHENVVAGLMPSTLYHCRITAVKGSGSTRSTFSLSTLAEEPSTPIKGLTFGPVAGYDFINPKNQMSGDTYYNCRADDGITYLTSNDTQGWQQNNYPPQHGSAISLVKFTNERPLAGITVNPLTAYGPNSIGTSDDQRSQKSSGLFCMAGDIYMAIGRQRNQATGGMGSAIAYTQTAGQVIFSADKGVSWNNFQSPTSFAPNGNPTTPPRASMFGVTPTNMGSATFVLYCGDDGTLGYWDRCNRHDNAAAYVYLLANEGYWDSGSAMFLARVPRARLRSLKGSDYQFYVGGDGTLDSSWTSAQRGAKPVISDKGRLGEPSVQFIPALNRYLLLTFSYPEGLAVANRHSEHTLWCAYEAPHPWGPWTLINSTEWPKLGYYNPIILSDTAYSGTSPTITFTGDFFGVGTYQMYTSTMTILH
jgi:hypothetical protein